MKYRLLSLIPKNLQSYMLGSLTRMRAPSPLGKMLNEKFVSFFNINMAEAEKPLLGYATIEDVFTRKLKDGARPIQGDLCAPCDGVLRISAPLEAGEAVQEKGLTYKIEELLYGNDQSAWDQGFQPYWYSSFYLAPHNYHRVHSPLAGTLKSILYIPGQLWPVNDTFNKIVPKLFCRNERVVFSLSDGQGGKAYLVMIGALHVGRIAVSHEPSLISNALTRQFRKTFPRTIKFVSEKQLEIGEELGTFMLGSSVVVVFDKIMAERFNLKKITTPSPICLGQAFPRLY